MSHQPPDLMPPCHQSHEIGGFSGPTLRPYQTTAHERAREAWAEGTEGALLVMATGTGKTLTALALVVRDYLENGKRVAWLAHRDELIRQPADEMAKHWPIYHTGIVKAETHQPRASLVFASVQTLAVSPHRAEEIAADGLDLVVVDEAHHASTPSYRTVLETLGAPRRLGLTATPHRADHADLSEDWTIAYAYSTADAVRDGYLLPPYAAVSRLPDLQLEEVSGRWDYSPGELGIELLRAGVVAHTVKAMGEPYQFAALLSDKTLMAKCRGRSCLVFTATIEQARLTAEALTEAGWKAEHISGKTPKAERRDLIARFRDGWINVLCNAAVLTEGTDLPVASVVVLARPTRSWSLYVQMVGRALRLSPGQTHALILDLAGATKDHSLISAPVLIGGTPCRKSGDGVHHYARTEAGGAKCRECGSTLACWERMGPHEWGEDHRCVCGRYQCPESSTHTHQWQALADFKRRCMCCGVETYDPLSGMVGRRNAQHQRKVEAVWVELPGLSPETWVAEVGDRGLVFVTTTDREGFEVSWLPHRHRTLKPITDGPVPRGEVRALADDLVSRDASVVGSDAGWRKGRPTRGQIERAGRYGIWPRHFEKAGELAVRVLKVRGRERAIAVGLAVDAS